MAALRSSRGWTTTIGLGFFFASIGCSPSIFFGESQDQGVLNTPDYRIRDYNCSEVDLSAPELNAVGFRALVRCFNRYHQLQEIHDWVSTLTDADLQPVMNSLNKTLAKPEKVYQLAATYSSLKGRKLAGGKKLLNESVATLGKFLDTGLVPELAVLLEKADQRLLDAVGLMADELTPGLWQKIGDFLLMMAKSSSFKELQEDFRTRDISDKYFENAIQGLHQYLKETHTFTVELQNLVATGELFTMFEKTLGTRPEEIQDRVPQLSTVVRATLKPAIDVTDSPTVVSIFGGLGRGPSAPSIPQKVILEDLGASLQAFDTPIECMNGGATIPNGGRHLISELTRIKDRDEHTRFVLKTLPLQLIALKPFCKLPDQLTISYRPLKILASHGMMGPMVDLLFRPVSSSEALMNFTTHLLTDRGAGNGGIRNLVPLLQSIADRQSAPGRMPKEPDGLVNLFLVASLPGQEDREDLKRFVQYLMKPQAKLSNQSILTVMNESLSSISVDHLQKIAEGLGKLFKDPDLIEAWLGQTREVFYSSDIHPAIDFLKTALADASKDPQIAKSLAKMLRSKKFSEAALWLPKHLKAEEHQTLEIIDAFFALYKKFTDAVASQVAIKPGETPAFTKVGVHDFKSTTMPESALLVAAPAISEKCLSLNLDFSLVGGSSSQAGFNEFIECLKGIDNSPLEDFSGALQYLATKHEGDSRSFLDLAMGFLSPLWKSGSGSLDPKEAAYLVDGWLGTIDDQVRWMQALPILMDPSAKSLEDSKSVFKPLLELGRAAVQGASKELRSVEEALAKLVHHEKVPDALANLEALKKYKPVEEPYDDRFAYRYVGQYENLAGPQLAPSSPGAPEAESATLQKWVTNRECQTLAHLQGPQKRTFIEERTNTILNEPRENLTTWDLDDDKFYPDGKKAPVQAWSLKEFRDRIQLIVNKASRREQSRSKKWVMNAQVDFLRYFSGKSGSHYDPDYFLEWLYQRSVDLKPIMYFYPGEREPRVRLVSSLDRLELVLIEVDEHNLLLGKNLALQFLEEIAHAWGDLPPNQWPNEIKTWVDQKKLKRPPTLEEAVHHIIYRPNEKHFGFFPMEDLDWLTDHIGFPKLPKCYPKVPWHHTENPSHYTDNPSYDSEKLKDYPRHTLASGFDWILKHIGINKVHDYQRHLYNIHQVVSVLTENAEPEEDSGYPGGKRPPGMAFLRDLFFQVYYSSPEDTMGPADGDKNNLSVILKTVKAGAFRQISRHLQGLKSAVRSDGKFLPADPAVRDFFAAIVHSAESPQIKAVLQELFPQGQEPALFWAAVAESFKLYEASRHGKFDEQGKPISTDWDLFQKAIFYSLAGLHKLQTTDRNSGTLLASLDGSTRTDAEDEASDALFSAFLKAPETLHDLILGRATEILRGNREFLTRRLNYFFPVLAQDSASQFLQASYNQWTEEEQTRARDFLREALKDAPEKGKPSLAAQAFKVLRTMDDGAPGALEELEERLKAAAKPLSDLKFDDLSTKFIRFFAQRSLTDGEAAGEPDAVKASEKLRTHLGDLLKTHALSEVIEMATGKATDSPEVSKKKADDFYKMLVSLSSFIGKQGSGDDSIKEFLDMLKRSLPAPTH